MGEPSDAASHAPVPGKCNARKKASRGGGLCGAPAGRGTDHPGIGACSAHLGNVANHRTAADREQARQACALFGLATSAAIDPAEALLGEVTRTHMAILYYEAEIALLPEDEQGRFRLYRQTRHASGEKTGEAKPHVLVVLWMAERKHLAEVTSKALSAGVAQRTLELQEGIARQVSSILARQARLLGHDPDSAAVRLASRQALELEAGDGRAAA